MPVSEFGDVCPEAKVHRPVGGRQAGEVRPDIPGHGLAEAEITCMPHHDGRVVDALGAWPFMIHVVMPPVNGGQSAQVKEL
jgi:hypothetical protein